MDDRERRRRWREALIGVYFSQGAPRCCSVSPESKTPCRLPDVPEMHDAGHEGWIGARDSAGWATSKADEERWKRLDEVDRPTVGS